MSDGLIFIMNVVLIAIAGVLVVGGATAGVYALVGHVASRTHRGRLDDDWRRHLHRRSGAILLASGTLWMLVAIPGFFTPDGATAGRWGGVLAGATMVAIGRLVMVKVHPRGR